MLKYKIGIIGLGYVGFPLAVEFSKHFITSGFDNDKNKIISLNKIVKKNKYDLNVSDRLKSITDCNIYIITVPTPINNKNLPDFKFLISASKLVGKVIKKK